MQGSFPFASSALWFDLSGHRQIFMTPPVLADVTNFE
jgi:hypothetical protein